MMPCRTGLLLKCHWVGEHNKFTFVMGGGDSWLVEIVGQVSGHHQNPPRGYMHLARLQIFRYIVVLIMYQVVFIGEFKLSTVQLAKNNWVLIIDFLRKWLKDRGSQLLGEDSFFNLRETKREA